MAKTYLPTKNNLIKLQNSIKQHKNGQKLLEEKELILKKRLEMYKDQQKQINNKINIILADAEDAIKKAAVDIGFDELIDISNAIKNDDTINIKYLTLMGVEIPSVASENLKPSLNYGLYNTTADVDKAIIRSLDLKKLIIELAETESTIIRLQKAIEKVERRSNALKEVIIPRDENLSKKITVFLEEAERDEFVRLKVVKRKQ